MGKNKEKRVGFGYDVHKIVRGKGIVLGGVTIPCNKKFKGHSDADILLHSLCDALLGAANLRDIGYYFPNTNSKYKNISSSVLLKEVYKLLRKNEWRIVNADCMIILEEPKIEQYIEEMKKNITQIIKTPFVSIKATTSERLGFVGQKRGAQCFSVVLIEK
ncbi:MAG: 2-C-methyl-D-erythritol 2,4-cyclodiphosphate synthase [Ignavibacteria bacterium]